jgi:hypothetical protein
MSFFSNRSKRDLSVNRADPVPDLKYSNDSIIFGLEIENSFFSKSHQDHLKLLKAYEKKATPLFDLPAISHNFFEHCCPG